MEFNIKSENFGDFSTLTSKEMWNLTSLLAHESKSGFIFANEGNEKIITSFVQKGVLKQLDDGGYYLTPKWAEILGLI